MAISRNSIKFHYFRSILLVFFATFVIFFNSTLILSCTSLQTQRQLLSQANVHSSTSVSSSTSTLKTGNNFGKGKVEFGGDEHSVPSGPNPISN